MRNSLAAAFVFLAIHAVDTSSGRQARQAAIARLNELHAVVQVARNPAGNNLDKAVLRVEFTRPVRDADLTCLHSLPETREVIFGSWSGWEGKTHNLYYAGWGITDVGLEHLAQLTNLRRLGLQFTRISDKGLDGLHKLGELEEVDLLGTECTDDGVNRLRKALPSCTVIWD